MQHALKVVTMRMVQEMKLLRGAAQVHKERAITDGASSQGARQGHTRDFRWLAIVAVGVFSFLIIFTHRPDALLNPQFLAEDGAYFYAQAYNLGALRAMTIPVAGYLVTSARIAALIAMFFPLSWGPAIFNILGIIIQASPVMFLFTDRFDKLIPNWYARGAFAFLYLAQPGSFELDAAMTYSQWHIALLAFLIVIATPRTSLWWRVFDGGVLLLAGLSGPFCLLLAPIILLRWLRTRSPHLMRLFALDIVASAVQVVVLVANLSVERAHGALGISAVDLSRIIAGQILLAATVGGRITALVALTNWWVAGWLPVLFAIGVAIFLALALRSAPQELRLLWLFGALILATALASPVTSGPGTYWQRLAHPLWNLRYEFLLNLAWLTTLVWILAARQKPLLRRVALILLAFTCMAAIPLDWSYPAYMNYHYQSYARQFEQMPPGSRIVIPLNPGNWTMTLIRR